MNDKEKLDMYNRIISNSTNQKEQMYNRIISNYNDYKNNTSNQNISVDNTETKKIKFTDVLENNKEKV